MPSDLELLVYPDPAFGGTFATLPGVRLASAILSLPDDEARKYLDRKLWQGCRKLALAWYGGDQALRAEAEFYSQTLQESPALFGEHAIYVHYHLEAFVLLARAAMDIAAGAFGRLLPAPFKRGRYDSLNDLVKRIVVDCGDLPLGTYCRALSGDPSSWLGILTSVGERRGLRDKLAHQMEFPIDYREFRAGSEKERPFVFVTDDTTVPLEKFVDDLRTGVVSGFLRLEDECLEANPGAT
jgi:hypothetical protein